MRPDIEVQRLAAHNATLPAAEPPTDNVPVVATSDNAGPHSHPVVVMLGLFTCMDCLVSATMIESGATIWLDLITAGGQHTRALATITGITAVRPDITIETHYRDWADRPEVRWHLCRETARLYRTYLDDRAPSTARHPRPTPRNCPEPGGAQVVWRRGE